MKKILSVLLLALFIFGVYAPAVQDGFVWDDTALILRDPLIRSWRLIPEGFQHFLFTDATASNFYRPMQRLTYTLDYAAFGFQPAGYHIVSIAWHFAAAVALFFFASELLRFLKIDERARRWVPLVATIAWAIHPVQTAAVVYVSGRADSLAAAFGFAGLYFGLRSLRAADARKWTDTALSAAMFLLSTLSKELGFVYLAAWLIILLAQKDWKASRRALIASLVVLAFYLSLRLPAEHLQPPVHPPLPALVRPILVARAFAEYTELAFLPLNLHMDRDVETRPTGFNTASTTAAAWRELETLAGLILMATFLYWIFRERKRDRAVFLLLLLTLAAYLPISGIFTLNATIAEHWLYLPTAFLFLALTLCAARVAQRPIWKPLLLSLAAVWLVFLGGRTFLRTFDWKDQHTFFERTIADGGDSARMLINLAGVEASEGKLDDAKKHLLAALRKEPDQPLGVLHLASVAVKQNDFATAHAILKRAAEMPLVEAQAYELMAVLENKETGKINSLRLRLAARTGPPDWSIEKRYVKALDQIGATEAAIDELRHVLATQSYRAESWQMLGQLLAKSGNQVGAVDAFASANRYDVRLAEHPNP